MSTRSERDKGKALQERHQAILSALLKDEDNKYCVDCDAKGPRWASWNLGIFLCIRCAGIHRNLGVHISKVKSVNLDSWTPEQIAMMQEMGNSRARAVYEANLQDNFRRPQTDSGLEAFIRAKYEQKKYIAREWIPPQPKLPHYVDEEPKKEKKKTRPKSSGVSLNSVSSPTKKPTSTPKPEPIVAKKPEPPKQSAAVDLLGLDDGPAGAASSDLFGDFISSTIVPNSPTAASVPVNNNHNATSASSPAQSNVESLGDVNLFGAPTENGAGATGITTEAVTGKKSKDSILALYGASGAAQQQPQQQQQQQHQMFAAGAMQGGMYGGMMNGMMPQNTMMQQQQPQLQQAHSQMWNGAVPQQQQQQQQQHQQHMMAQQQMVAAAMMGGMPQQQQQHGGYNMQAMYGMQQQQPQPYQQQQQFQQMQQQFGGMALGGGGSYPQMATAAAGGGVGGGQWNGQQPSSGHTLSNNLWQ